MNKYREALLSQGLTPKDLRVGTDKENWYGLLMDKSGLPIIAMEGGSMYLSKKMALKIYNENPNKYLLAEELVNK
jgi:hypothetical protein